MSILYDNSDTRLPPKRSVKAAPSPIEEDKSHRFYDSPSSKAHRAEIKAAGEAPGPVILLRRKHLDEKQALAVDHRKRGREFHSQQDDRRDQALGRGANPAHAWMEKERRERKEIDEKFAAERQALADRHRKEMEAMVKKHPAE